MDGPRFDAIAKSLSTTGPRRRLLAGLLGAALAGGLGRAVGRRDASAAASHLCCTYLCGQTLTTSCSRRGGCPPPPVGCSTVEGSGYFVKRCRDCAPRPAAPAPCPPGQQCSGGRCCDAGFVACPGNPTGCIPASTACSGEPVCCSDNGQGAAIVCGFQGQCPAGSAPPPATCPPAG